MKKRAKAGKRSKRFDVVATVKANARTQVGQPKPVRVIAEKSVERQGEKHKASLAETLANEGNNH